MWTSMYLRDANQNTKNNICCRQKTIRLRMLRIRSRHQTPLKCKQLRNVQKHYEEGVNKSPDN